MKKRGFTLIELLVVIAIIAILAAILFPVFTAAKQRGQQASCMANLSQIGKALQMYAQSNDSCLPTIRRWIPPFANLTLDNYTSQYEARGYWVWSWRKGGIARMLFPYLAKSESVFACPADKWVLTDANGNPIPDDRIEVSYEYRWVVAWNTASRMTVRESEFIRPSRQIVYHERMPFHWDHRQRIWGSKQETPWVNSLYMDGRTAMRRVHLRDDGVYDLHWFTQPRPLPRQDLWVWYCDVRTGWDD